MHKCSVSLSKDEEGNFVTTFGRFVKEYEILGRTVTRRRTYTATLKEKIKIKLRGGQVSDMRNSAYVHLQTITSSYYHVKGNIN